MKNNNHITRSIRLAVGRARREASKLDRMAVSQHYNATTVHGLREKACGMRLACNEILDALKRMNAK